jgi:hypothetical protein
MIAKQLDQITEDDLQRLIGTSEDRQSEFKESLGRSDDQVKEFLKDVSAMANAIGGDIIYGIVEGVSEDGNTVAQVIQGISGENSDDEILRLDNLIRDCIKPRLVGIGIRALQLSNNNTAFIVRVPRSWNAPHVVDRRGHWRFYYRDSAGSHPMDITELRHAMTFADTLGQRLEEFRLDRLAKIATDALLERGPKIALHFQPLSSVELDSPIDIARMRVDSRKFILIPFDGIESELRINFDGLRAYNSNSPLIGYIQVFRNGTIEAVDTRLLRDEGAGYLPARTFEQRIINTTVRCLGTINDLGIASPVRFHISLLSVSGHKLKVQTWAQHIDTYIFDQLSERFAIDRDELLLPGLLFSEEDVAQFSSVTIPDNASDTRYSELFRYVGRLLHPLFNVVWNAAGFRGSLYYDAEGIWTGQINH